jgi:hypothetical protein
MEKTLTSDCENSGEHCVEVNFTYCFETAKNYIQYAWIMAEHLDPLSTVYTETLPCLATKI